MAERIYTEEEIITSLEAYAESMCNKCAIKDLRRFCDSCFINVIKQAPALIKRQKADIERLQKYSAGVDFKRYQDGRKAAIVEIFMDIAREMGSLLPVCAVRLISGRSIGKSFELGREKAISDVLKILAELEEKYKEGGADDGGKQ